MRRLVDDSVLRGQCFAGPPLHGPPVARAGFDKAHHRGQQRTAGGVRQDSSRATERARHERIGRPQVDADGQAVLVGAALLPGSAICSNAMAASDGEASPQPHWFLDVGGC